MSHPQAGEPESALTHAGGLFNARCRAAHTDTTQKQVPIWRPGAETAVSGGGREGRALRFGRGGGLIARLEVLLEAVRVGGSTLCDGETQGGGCTA